MGSGEGGVGGDDVGEELPFFLFSIAAQMDLNFHSDSYPLEKREEKKRDKVLVFVLSRCLWHKTDFPGSLCFEF